MGQKPYEPTAAKTGKSEALSNQNLPAHLQTYRVVKVVLACKALSRASAPKLPCTCTVCSHMQIADADLLAVDHLHDLGLKVAGDTHLVPWPWINQESNNAKKTCVTDIVSVFLGFPMLLVCPQRLASQLPRFELPSLTQQNEGSCRLASFHLQLARFLGSISQALV